MKKKITCIDCDYQSKDSSDFQSNNEGEPLCIDCLDNNYVNCWDSGELTHRDNVRYVDSIEGYVDSDTFCDHYGYCADCEYSTHLDGLYWDEREEDYFCEGCYNPSANIDLSEPPSATSNMLESKTFKRNKRKICRCRV